ncbi:hypothetical protein [Propionivibrio sp.]|uniref:hypothetical protein n=1 Tax=Propionivibrio sp. TaxID=2212460 RepID=UPI00260431C3|nr:hypothetical protein [Propionivibrio sp.]
MDGIGVITEVIVGELPQPSQLGVDGGSASEVGVEDGLLGVHRELHDVIDDATMSAPFNPEAAINFTEKQLRQLTPLICRPRIAKQPEKCFLQI